MAVVVPEDWTFKLLGLLARRFFVMDGGKRGEHLLYTYGMCLPCRMGQPLEPAGCPGKDGWMDGWKMGWYCVHTHGIKEVWVSIYL